MQLRFCSLGNSKLSNNQGNVGHVVDMLVEPHTWLVRYLLVKGSRAFSATHFLISPASIANFDMRRNIIQVGLADHELRAAPKFDGQLPLTRKFEHTLVNQFGWPIYWLGRNENSEDSPLVTLTDLMTMQVVFDVQGGAVAKEPVTDFGVHLESWRIDYIVAEDETGLLSDDKVLVTDFVKTVDEKNKIIYVNQQQKYPFSDRSTSKSPSIVAR